MPSAGVVKSKRESGVHFDASLDAVRRCFSINKLLARSRSPPPSPLPPPLACKYNRTNIHVPTFPPVPPPSLNYVYALDEFIQSQSRFNQLFCVLQHLGLIL